MNNEDSYSFLYFAVIDVKCFNSLQRTEALY